MLEAWSDSSIDLGNSESCSRRFAVKLSEVRFQSKRSGHFKFDFGSSCLANRFHKCFADRCSSDFNVSRCSTSYCASFALDSAVFVSTSCVADVRHSVVTHRCIRDSRCIEEILDDEKPFEKLSEASTISKACHESFEDSCALHSGFDPPMQRQRVQTLCGAIGLCFEGFFQRSIFKKSSFKKSIKKKNYHDKSFEESVNGSRRVEVADLSRQAVEISDASSQSSLHSDFFAIQSFTSSIFA